MRIFQVIFFEYILGYMLQGFAIILGIFAFCKRKIEAKKFLISSVIMIVILYVMRHFITFGIHTILDLICAFLIGILYLKMPPFTVIRSILVITVFLLITEILNVVVMTNILGKELFDSMMLDSIQTYIVGLPAAIIFAALNLISYFLLLKNKKGDNDGKDSV